MVPAKMDPMERAFLANIEKGEKALAVAETDYERLQVRDTARDYAFVTSTLGWHNLTRRSLILVQRAERAIVKANPRLTPKERGQRIRDSNNGIVLASSEIISASLLSALRKAHEHISDDDFEALANEDTDEPLTRAQLIRVGREKERA